MAARIVLPLSQLVEHLVREVNRANGSGLHGQAGWHRAETDRSGNGWDLPALAVDECQFTLHLAEVRPIWIARVWHWVVQLFGGSPAPSPTAGYELVPPAKAEMTVRIRVVREGSQLKVVQMESEPPPPALASLRVQSATNWTA
jgi:hypothetical protein